VMTRLVSGWSTMCGLIAKPKSPSFKLPLASSSRFEHCASPSPQHTFT
jgi:hypothetical protein